MDRAVFASLLADRRAALCLCGAAALHLGLTAAGLGGWPCPVMATLGVPCPGCGLTRAAMLLVRGEFGRALAMHAFAPALVGALGLLLVAAFTGKSARERLAGAVRKAEIRTGFSAGLLAALLIYWIARLCLDARGFARLVN